MRSPNPICRRRIEAAKLATQKIDIGIDLWRVLDRLIEAGKPSNGAGVYADIPRLKSALAAAQGSITAARRIVEETDWPTETDYDNA